MRALDPRLVRRARPVRVLLGVDVALGALTALLVLVQATLLARIVARAFAGATLGAVAADIVLLALAFAARGLLAWGFEVAGARAASDVLSGLRLQLVARRLRAQPAALDRVEAAEIAAAGVHGADGLEAYFGRYLPQVVLGVLAVAVSAHAAGSLDRVLIAMLALLALASFEALQSGPSGSGKTTIVNLLVRFLDPEDGRVTLGGRDPREYRQEDVRRAIAVAGQDSHLFSTTIRENVRLARPDAADEEIEDALRRARILDWVRSLPDGWNTLVGEEGGELSGGQRQRLVVARALLANAPVLVLDEPTAHLDPQTAERLIDDVLDAAAGRTVLLITHRPEGLDRIDEIMRLRG